MRAFLADFANGTLERPRMQVKAHTRARRRTLPKRCLMERCLRETGTAWPTPNLRGSIYAPAWTVAAPSRGRLEGRAHGAPGRASWSLRAVAMRSRSTVTRLRQPFPSRTMIWRRSKLSSAQTFSVRNF